MRRDDATQLALRLTELAQPRAECSGALRAGLAARAQRRLDDVHRAVERLERALEPVRRSEQRLQRAGAGAPDPQARRRLRECRFRPGRPLLGALGRTLGEP